MKKKVICYIQAFDCEETIEAAMKSILGQTYENWLCFVLSNGNILLNNNSTFDIIKSFAVRDRRFIILNKKYNDVGMYIPMLYYLALQFPNCYLCSLDADDIYESDFFERAVSMATEKGLGIVACGTEIVLKKNAGARKEKLICKREIKEDLVIKKEDFTTLFSVYKPFFNEMWGKLYDTNLFGANYDRKYVCKKFYNHFLPDTLFAMDNLLRCESIGILGGTSHRFYQFTQRSVTNATVMSNAYTANQKRNLSFFRQNNFSVYKTYDTIFKFLRSHGEITPDLYEYMQAVLFGWFNDFYTRTMLLTTDEAKLARHAANLVFHPKFDEVMRYRDSGKYHNLKNYEKRRDFCELFKNTLICQEIMKNREFGRKTHKIVNLNCTGTTKRRINKVIGKLDETIQFLSKLQDKGE